MRLKREFSRKAACFSVNPPRPTLVAFEGTVVDVNRQAWSAAANLHVHQANVCVGLKVDRTFVPRGEPIAVNAIAADLAGKLVPGRSLQIRAARPTRGTAALLPLPLRSELRQW